MGEEKNTQNWSGITKWLVIGAVAITALFIFKDELKKFIGSADEIIVSKEGVILRKTKTKIGELNYSAEAVNTNRGEDGINGNVFTSLKYKFTISIPNSTDWYINNNVQRSLLDQAGVPRNAEVPVILMRSKPINQFAPNVNVVVMPVGSMNISQYAQQYEDNIHRSGAELISKNIDNATQGALFVYYSNMFGKQLYQFARIAVRNGNVYEVTATGLPPVDEVNDSVKHELASMLNSFKFIGT